MRVLKKLKRLFMNVFRTANNIVSNLIVVVMAAVFLSDQYPTRLLIWLVLLALALCFMLSLLSEEENNE
jgi:hypothetical protein